MKLMFALYAMDIAIALGALALSGSWVMALLTYVVCVAISIYITVA